MLWKNVFFLLSEDDIPEKLCIKITFYEIEDIKQYAILQVLINIKI